jgi:hypothetical protein
MKTAFFISLVALATASAQPIDVRDELWYPTNPPKKAFQDKQEQSEIQKKSQDALLKALRDQAARQNRSPEDLFLEAYKAIQVGQKNIQNKEYSPAKENLTQAITTLSNLQNQFPEWGEEIVRYRVDIAQSLLTSLPSK